MKRQHTALWIDNIAKISALAPYLDAAKSSQSSTGKKTVVTIIIYNLPNRDCSAAASAGEIACADSDCVDGINTYKTQYVDPIVEILKQYPTLTIATIIEPDSLPNIATNLGVAKCAQAEKAYRAGTSYTISSLATINNVAIYLDAAHGGWLGWNTNLRAIATIFKSVVDNAGGPGVIRGFATNVANYQPLGSTSNSADPCKFQTQGNSAIDEVHYINLLDAALNDVGITQKGYVVDTGRNGGAQTRATCANWCNIRNAGAGQRPSADTAGVTGSNKIDAFVWVKPPGESDGTSDTSAPRYDPNCSTGDALQGAPEAGKLFTAHLAVIAQNAKPALDTTAVPSGTPGNSDVPTGCSPALCVDICGKDAVKQCDCRGGVLVNVDCATENTSSIITYSISIVMICWMIFF
eukprot:TRINITY_DN1084_c0_g1_i1.p1 TRINITY_DN1084_c0_g1~~TRINITY_DN1084_c0_g1_i1.p1  ORF type:complete len:475 (-),score=128.48 TRINITY_DN1084_c0_g1_i1:51-1274(-)